MAGWNTAAPIQTTDEKSPANEAAEKHPEVAKALEQFKQGQFDQCVAALREAVKAHPELPAPYVLMSQFFLLSNQLPGARSMLEKAVLENAADPEPYLMLGDLAFRERRYTDSRLLLEKAASLVGAYPGPEDRKKALEKRSHVGLASVAEAVVPLAEKAEQPALLEQANTHLKAWVAAEPESAPAHFRLGKTLFGLGKTKEAYAELQAANTLSTELPSADVTVGRLYEQQGDRANADKWMDYAVTKAPKDIKARIEVVQFLWETGRSDKAKPHAEEALKIDPDSTEAQIWNGVIARFLKDYPKATEHLEKAFLAQPDNPQIGNQLALVLIEQPDESKRNRAVRVAMSLYNQDQQNAVAAATLGWVLYRTGKLPEAEQAMRVAAQMSKGNVTSDMAYFMAKVNHERGRPAEAKQILDSALKSTGPFAYRDEAQAWQNQLGATTAKP